MKNVALFNETFSIAKTSTYHLSLQLAHKFYSYCIVDSIRNRYVAIKHYVFESDFIGKTYTEKVNFMLKNDAFLNKNYKRVDFSFVTNRATLVPFQLFDKENLRNYFTFNQQLFDYEEIHFNKIESAEANNIFAIPSEITTLLVNRFPEIKFYHQATPFISNSIRIVNELSIKGQYIQVNINPDFFEIIVIIHGKLILYNSFIYQTHSDIVYFILNILNQLNLKIELSEIYISGDIEKKSDFTDLLKKVNLKSNFSSIKGGAIYGFADVPEHYFAVLLNLYRCE